MQDMRKTKAQLVRELEQLRRTGHHDELEVRVAERTRALEQSERKFRSLAEATVAQICIVQENRYVYANQAFLDYHMLEPEDLRRVTPDDLMMGIMSPETIARAEAAWRATMARGDSRFRFEYQDLEGCWFQTIVTMMELDGKPAFMTMDLDITEIKRAQTEMYRADKMAALGQMIAGVAHEINNPNNFIFFNLPILRRYIEAIKPLLEQRLEQEPDLQILKLPYAVFMEDVLKLLENMEHGSTRITSIISDLKNYVRSDEAEERKAAEVSQVVNHVMTLVGKQVRKMVKRLEVSIADPLPPVAIGAGKIEQVLINLLINAGQAADKEESWVRVTARPATGDDGSVELTVEDNGAGIPEAIQQQIFEPFFTSKGRDQGTGLGLSISHRIIEEHGGTIAVESTLGEGARFTVLLPAAERV